MTKRAVVLLSGGLDSTTVLAIAASQDYELYAITFDYGQRHSVEIQRARAIADLYAVHRHLVIDCNFRSIGGSALTDSIDVPKTKDEIHSSDRIQHIPVTYVPARNTIFLSFALAWAETLEAQDIFIGANAIDYSGYPDCRPEFMEAFEKMANIATRMSVEDKKKIRIQTPLIALSKAEIIRRGTALGVDYAMTWSCYDPIRSASGERPCLECESCRLRQKGFIQAGVADPLNE